MVSSEERDFKKKVEHNGQVQREGVIGQRKELLQSPSSRNNEDLFSASILGIAATGVQTRALAAVGKVDLTPVEWSEIN